MVYVDASFSLTINTDDIKAFLKKANKERDGDDQIQLAEWESEVANAFNYEDYIADAAGHFEDEEAYMTYILENKF